MSGDPRFRPERPDWPGLRTACALHVHDDLPALIAHAPVGPLWLPTVSPDRLAQCEGTMRRVQAALLEAGIPVLAFDAVIGFQPDEAKVVDPAALRGLRAACAGLIILDMHRRDGARRAWCDALSFHYRLAPIHWVQR